MDRSFAMPRGPIVERDGAPNVPGRGYLTGIQTMSQTLNNLHALTNLDGATSYSNDELRDKIIEIINALQT
jgi:hypothetical protein